MNQIENIDNFKKNDDKLSTAGQPTEIEFDLIAEKGFEVVINIRSKSEMLDVFDEKKIVENLGLKYFQIPVTLETLNSKILSKFFELMEQQEDKNIFLHCRRNIRVSIILSLYQIIKLGWKKEDAFNELSEMVQVTPALDNLISEQILHFRNI